MKCNRKAALPTGPDLQEINDENMGFFGQETEEWETLKRRITISG